MSKKIEVRKCAKCGKKFTSKVNNQKYCCVACKNAVKRENAKGKRIAAATKKASDVAKAIAKNIKVKDLVKADEKTVTKSVVKQTVKLAKPANCRKVIIRKGDAVEFRDFPADRIASFAIRLLTMAVDSVLAK